ncbi:MAG TPA: hypothetical protein P5038_15460, partial [Candidatus Paceibacterota bacterium]|nr:hypothetical protein [Candidatus Paceibacterota bacterium]
SNITPFECKCFFLIFSLPPQIKISETSEATGRVAGNKEAAGKERATAAPPVGSMTWRKHPFPDLRPTQAPPHGRGQIEPPGLNQG